MNLTINNQPVQTDNARTVLDVAVQNGIYIPTLCAHPELVPYGGCRLCVIEVEGRRGYPTACTTMVEEGMIIRTETQAIQEMRKELIQLILSEHPSACLICEDVEGCTGFQDTIRKVGVTTGCRWCPKDKDCELQKVVDYLEVKELIFPGLYRNLPIEKYDPFFDRDYNLCIYCGRCVRICTEHRKSNVLALKQRGKLTTIGPAFEENHIEAGCEFCGACVSVCPTGAMSEKSKKWWGIPEEYNPSFCPLCSLNCELQVLTSKNKVIGTVPTGDPHQSGGTLCVKGRFCLSEMINRTPRVLEPEFKYAEGHGIVDWEFALKKASEFVKDVAPGKSALFVSPSLTLEEIYAAKAFAEKVLKTDLVSSSALNANLADYLQLNGKTVAPGAIPAADAIVSFFLNGNYKYAPVTIGIKDAASNGVPYFQVGWLRDTTTRFARKRFIPGKGDSAGFLEDLLAGIKEGRGKDKDLLEMVKMLKAGKKNLFIVGPEIISLSNCRELTALLREIAGLVKAKFLLVNQYGNLPGLLSLVDLKPMEMISQMIRDGDIDLLYLVGDIPYETRPRVRYIIYQNAFPAPEAFSPDLIIPAAVWGETGGSYLKNDKIENKFNAVATVHGYAMPHDAIFEKIAKASGVKGGLPKFKKINGAELNIEGFTAQVKESQKRKRGNPSSLSDSPYTLVQENDQHVYSGFSLARGLEGLNELVRPGYVIMHPADAGREGMAEGEEIWLSALKEEKKFRITLRRQVEKGFLFLVTEDGKAEFNANPCPVKIRREHV